MAARIYSTVRPLLDIEAPTAFWTNVNPATLNSIIMLRDMTDVREFCSLSTVMTEEMAFDQMDMLARLHARFYKSDDAVGVLAPLATWSEFWRKLDGFHFEDICARGFTVAEEVIPEALFARADEIWPATEFATSMHQGRSDFLTHGDVHLRNWYVSGSGRMGLTDWQTAGRGHWSRDVAYTISTSCSPEMRRALERQLIERYLERLASYGGPTVPFESAWQDYIEQLFSALSFWTVTIAPSDLPDMQPRDAAMEMIRRIAIAIDDCDALDRRRGR